jgi:hypothetical protein
MGSEPPLVRIGKHVSGMARCPEVSADDDGARRPYPLPVRRHCWLHRECAFDADNGKESERFPMPSRGAPFMLEPGRRDAASAGNSMMVLMSGSLWLAAWLDFAGDRPSLRTGRG